MIGKSDNSSVAAVMILFHPDPHLLFRLVHSVVPQVDKLFVVDNTPGYGHTIPAVFNNCGRPVTYQANGLNKGVATAQNIGIHLAMLEHFTHVLLLDQDSALPPGAVESLLAAEQSLLRAGKHVAAVGPLFIDEKSGHPSCGVRHSWFRVQRIPIDRSANESVETDYLISSGSLMRSSVLNQVGLMRDELFIDWVDAEWGFRARSCGYQTYIVPSVVMLHSIGDATVRFFGCQINLHSAARDYYIVRNAAYLLRERRMGWNWRLVTIINIPKHIIVHAWFSRRRWVSLRQMLHAIWQGLFGKMTEYHAI
jgi:rhamnosyltransferase